MARRRFFADRVTDGEAVIEGENAHHLTRVLRVEPGQKYEITDNSRVWLAEVKTTRKTLVEFTLLEEIEAAPALPAITLYLALIKFERFEWAVEKATELGISRLVPVEASRSERGLADGARKRVERWRRIAREASEQSRRLSAPEIEDPVRFDQMLSCEATHRIWLDERPAAPALIDTLKLSKGDSCALAVGPEGGWSDPERIRFDEAKWTGASLGPAVLRADTAVCAALGVWLQLACRQASAGKSIPPTIE
jgi:16S rRNA (uracil1498-N3)-methyltransferase